jgi:mono/diheme cytochrome c family protein
MIRKRAVVCLFTFSVLVAAAWLCRGAVVPRSAQASQEKQPEKQTVQVPKEVPAELKIPEEEAKRANPIKPTESSVAEGRKLYGYQCAMCHGEKGEGKGELVEPMKLKLRDWTDAEALKDLTDGALNYILLKGKGKMPGQEGRMTPQQQWHLINFIRSLGKKKEPAKAAEPPKPGA